MSFTKPARPPQTESWWIGLTREQFYQRLAHEDATRFRFHNKSVGPFDTPGQMRVRRGRRQDLTWEE